MKEEIKEILEDLEHYSYCYDNYDKEKHSIKTLLDYITNLQEENEELKDTIDFIDNKYKNTINYNEKLIEYNQDYKQRNEKAIEYIKEHIKYECDDTFNGMSFYSYHLYDFKKDDLLNILKGDKDE